MNYQKQQLLNNLKYDTYCRIGVSKIHGVGVIAIKDIPESTNPFMMTNKKCPNYNCVEVSKNELNSLPSEVKKLVEDFIAPSKNKYCVPFEGMNSIDISFYMNHDPHHYNIDIVQTNCHFLEFMTNRYIKKGEELTINYQHLMDE
jgi:hypothetical protein